MMRQPQARNAWDERSSGPSLSGVFGGGFRDDRPAVISLILILLILLISVMAPLFSPYGMNEIDLDRVGAAPSPDHILGTDELGRDVFTRLLYGGRYSLFIAFFSIIIGVSAGIIFGSIAGYFRGPVDRAVCGLTDLFLSIPVFLILMVAASAAGGKIFVIPIVIGATSWMETARTVRSEFMRLRQEEFIEAARSLGVSDYSIVFRHILPQAVVPVTVSATAGFAAAILIESSLSFLGFGVQPPLPTWGNMLNNAQSLLRTAPVAAVAPGFLIFIVCLSFNFVAAGLKRVLARDSE
ncbi:MAG: ABC transporter permease [Candidatus Krumholzibacteria bacterium]|nr:ABC transporter permease [Candidatus Krumholzibacteria bacterium]